MAQRGRLTLDTLSFRGTPHHYNTGTRNHDFSYSPNPATHALFRKPTKPSW
jgi:hypothetical protein